MKNIYFLYGSDYHAIQTYINKLKVTQPELRIETFPLSKLDDIENFYNQSINTSLFNKASLCLVDMNLRLFNQMDKVLNEFIQFITNLSSSKMIILTLFSEKMDKNTVKKITSSSFFIELKSLACIEEMNKLFPWQTDAIKDKVLSLAKMYDLTFTNEALNLYIEHVKESLGSLDAELKSIQLFLLPRNSVDVSTVKLLFDVDLNIDDLFDSLLNKADVDISTFNSIIAKYESPLYILAALQSKIRIAINIKSYLLRNIGIYQISQMLHMNSYRLEKDAQKIKNISLDALISILSFLSKLEYKIKTGLVKADQIVDLILINRQFA